MDDERLKNPPGKGHIDYFDELLARIRDIRSSEQAFWRKVLDIYATSADETADCDTRNRQTLFFRASGGSKYNLVNMSLHGRIARYVSSRSEPHRHRSAVEASCSRAPRAEAGGKDDACARSRP